MEQIKAFHVDKNIIYENLKKNQIKKKIAPSPLLFPILSYFGYNF